MWLKINALIRFYYKIEPEKISLDKRCKLEQELFWLSEQGVINIKLSRNAS